MRQIAFLLILLVSIPLAMALPYLFAPQVSRTLTSHPTMESCTGTAGEPEGGRGTPARPRLSLHA